MSNPKETGAAAFNVKDWCEYEIQANVDGYGNNRAEAIDFVYELIITDEYRDELTDAQSLLAQAYLKTLRREHV